MKGAFIAVQLFCSLSNCWAQLDLSSARLEAEYYVFAYAQHYRVPIAFVRAIIERESNWQPCTVSPKGAVGLMQLMPLTAKRMGVQNRCNPDQNVSGGVRYLAWLTPQFHGDLRLVAAAYYAGGNTIGRRGLAYRNPDVVAYVTAIRTAYLREVTSGPESKNNVEKRDVR
jgi:soluble lytic murein transglycosylase